MGIETMRVNACKAVFTMRLFHPPFESWRSLRTAEAMTHEAKTANLAGKVWRHILVKRLLSLQSEICFTLSATSP